MSQKILLSVIIPAYNVEDTIARCVDSVLRQDVAGMELIIVDDGSTDATPSICDAYTANPAVTVVHTVNGGLSVARNNGIERARGELITFVDSDDYLADNTYGRLVDIATAHPDYDIIEFPVVKEDGTTELFRTALTDTVYTDMAQYWTDGRAYAHSYACNKVYRRRLFDKVRFPRGRKFEDAATLPLLLRHARAVRTVTKGLYHYTFNRNGITARADAKALRQLLDAHRPLIDDSRLRAYDGFADYYYNVLNIQISLYTVSGDDADIVLPTLPYRQNTKLRLLHILGMRNLCRLFRLVYHLTGRQ